MRSLERSVGSACWPAAVPSSFIFGLTVRSNRPIPCAQPSARARRPDLDVVFGAWPRSHAALQMERDHWYSSDDVDEHGQPALVIDALAEGSWFHLRYLDGTEFLVDRSGTRLWASWIEPLTLEDTATYLLGPVMGFVLLLRGTHCLHASAIRVGERALAIVGRAGAGKSTTAAAFVKLGYRVLADDVTTLACEGDALMVHPAYPCIRLWPKSVDALFGAPDALPLLTPNWDKRYFDLVGGGDRFQADPLPLAAIYVLGERAGEAAPRIAALSPPAAMMELVANGYAPRLKDKAARASEFKVLSRVVGTVPVRRVIPGASLADVSRLCRAIIADFEALMPAHASPRCT